MRWLVFFVCGALAALGCSTDTQQGESGGSLALDLTIADGIEINVVAWEITGGDMEPMSGLINTSAPGSTASVEVFGLPPGEDYLIEMMAIATDEETMCKGAAFFDIEVGEVTEVHVMLNCKRPERFGGVRVDGWFNLCAELTKVVVSPLQTSVGNLIDLSSSAVDEESDSIRHMWTGTGGTITDPSAASTTYKCGEVGDHVVRIVVSDDDFTYCVSEWTVAVTCVAVDGDLCDEVTCDDLGECIIHKCNPANGMCEKELVDIGEPCDDGGTCDGEGNCNVVSICSTIECDECNACDPATGLCAPADEGADCGEGGTCMNGDCIEVDLCQDVTCEDTGNDCTVGVCNNQTGECDPMNLPDETACADDTGVCIEGECQVGNMCDGVICDSGMLCVDGGTCNPTNGQCEGGGNEPADTDCENGGVCDGAGACVECNDGTQCPDDENQCTMAACALNICGQANVMNGMVCDLFGLGDGFCEEGVCIEAPDCILDTQCDDLDVCTINTCVEGTCASIPAEDGTTCVAGGDPGSCQAGVCVALCDGVNCDDGNECTSDGACNPANGECEGGGFEPMDTACAQAGGSVCDGEGTCVQCNSADQCTEDGNECTAAACQANVCGQSNVSDGTSCDDGNGECQTGMCEPAGPPTYDLSQSIFKPYNSLLSVNTDPGICQGGDFDGGGSDAGRCNSDANCPGDPPGICIRGQGTSTDDCFVPDLRAVPDASLTNQETKCLILPAPAVAGFISFDETSPGNFDVFAVQFLDFVIDVTLDFLSAQVVVTTMSRTEITGTATGAIPGVITLDLLADPFNVNTMGSGNVNCTATDLDDGSDVSTGVCPLAGLPLGGDNPVPLPGDPGMRTIPPITIGAASFELGTGNASATGYYLSNPADLANDGSQFIALAGVQIN
jgi:hypothetical protein